MPEVDLMPNKNRIVRALDVYREGMRGFLMEKLQVSAPTSGAIKDLVVTSLPERLYQPFLTLSTNDEIKEALEEKHFPYLIEKNWDECFKPVFGYDLTVKQITKNLVKTRNSVSHPKNKDPDDRITIRRLDKMHEVLFKIGSKEGAQAVGGIRKEILVNKENGVDESLDEQESSQGSLVTECPDPAGTSVDADSTTGFSGNGVDKHSIQADSELDSEKASLAVQPIEYGYRIDDYRFAWNKTIDYTLWNIRDELWIVLCTESSLKAYRDIGTRAELVLALEKEINGLTAAYQFAEDYVGDYEDFAGSFESIDAYRSQIEFDCENEAFRLKSIMDESVWRMFIHPLKGVVSKVEQNQKTPALELVAVGDAEKLGSNPATGETFWRVGDTYWCAEESPSGIQAEVLDQEALERSHVISKLIPV